MPLDNTKLLGILTNLNDTEKELILAFPYTETVEGEGTYSRWITCINNGNCTLTKYNENNDNVYDWSVIGALSKNDAPRNLLAAHELNYLIVSDNVVYGTLMLMSSEREQMYDSAIESGITIMDLADIENAYIGNIWDGQQFRDPE